jgi:hypothetical protein
MIIDPMRIARPRDLTTASRILLELKLDKGTRNEMKGKTWNDAVTLGMEARLTAYGGKDALACWELADKFLDQWPEREQRLARAARTATTQVEFFTLVRGED